MAHRLSSDLHGAQPPGGLWRWAALLWLVVVAGVALHQWRFWQQDRIDTDVLALLPVNEQAPDVTLATQQMADRLAREVVVLLEAGDGASTRAAAQAFRQALAQSIPGRFQEESHNSQASMQAALAFYEPWRDRLLTPQQRDRLASASDAALVQQALQDLYQPGMQARLSDWLSDPLGLWTQWWTARSALSQARPRDGELWVAEGERQWIVLRFALSGSAFRLSGQPELAAGMQSASSHAREVAPAMRMLVAGVPLHAEAAAVQAHGEINTIGWGSLAGVLLLAWLAFRSVRPMMLVALSLLVGCAVALSVTVWLFGQVHLLTLVFGVSLVGVAEDYGIHYFAARQGSQDQSSHRLMRSLLPALLLALGTSAIAYLALGVAAFPGLRQMAVFSVVGLVAAMLTVVCWVPWLDKGVLPDSPLAQRIGGTLQAWPRWSGWMGIALCVLSLVLLGWLWQSGKLRVQDDVRQLQNASPSLVEQQRQVGQMLGLPSPAQFYLVKGRDAQEVLVREEALKERLDALVRQGRLQGYSAVSDWVPSVQRQQANAQLAVRARQAVLQGASAHLNESLQPPPRLDAEPLEVDAWLAQPIAAAARPLWLGAHDGLYRSMVMLRGVQGAESLAALTQASDGLDGVTWVDKPAEISALLQRYRVSMTELLLAGHGLVLGVLCLRFGRRAWRAWVPTVLASAVVVAAMVGMGGALQLFHVLALVLLLGVGIDYGIFLQEHEEDPQAWLAVVMGAGSTWLSFGLLGLSQTPALRAFGQTLMLGLPLVLVLAPLFRGSARTVTPPGAPASHVA